MQTETSVILPAYNEALALPPVLEAVLGVIDDRTEVLVVDDGSSDGSAEIARRYPCRVLQHRHNQGKGAAVRTGLLAARGRFVIVMDADNTYPADAIPRMIAHSADYDFIRCVRHNGTANMPPVNRLGNKVFDYTLKAMHGLEGGDHLSGLYGLRRETLQAMSCTANGFDLEVEIGIKARAHKLRCLTLPIAYNERLGEKKLNAWRDGWRILCKSLNMALLYNPYLSFVLPGLFVWILAGLLTIALSGGPVPTRFGGLRDHSLIVAGFGVTVGFQFIIFGIAAALYSIACGVPATGGLVALARPVVRQWAVLCGALLALGGLSCLGTTLVRWLVTGGGNFENTRLIVLSGSCLTFGLQLVLATMFVSIFAGRIGQTVQPAPIIELVPELEQNLQAVGD